MACMVGLLSSVSGRLCMMLQIDEFIKTGTLAALNEAEASAEGGDVPQKHKAVEGKAKDMAAKFL